MKIQDNVFVVTGGGNGIGREVVLGLLDRGARVAAVDVRVETLQETTALAGVGERLSTHVVDLADRAAVMALPEQVVAAHGRVDGLLNVAGIIQRFVPFDDLTYDDIEMVLAVNLWGVVHTIKAFLPLLKQRPEACVVNVSSMGGFVPVPGRAVATGIADNSGVTIPGADVAREQSGTLTSATAAADQILDGLTRGRYRVVIGKDARMLDRLSRLAPRRATDLVAKKMAALLSR
jgi:NAD(P)-dependent dehydrogenase (short-subunit alcohol dehydrogenase family)